MILETWRDEHRKWVSMCDMPDHSEINDALENDVSAIKRLFAGETVKVNLICRDEVIEIRQKL